MIQYSEQDAKQATTAGVGHVAQGVWFHCGDDHPIHSTTCFTDKIIKIILSKASPTRAAKTAMNALGYNYNL
jgi:hypothetical protein